MGEWLIMAAALYVLLIIGALLDWREIKLCYSGSNIMMYISKALAMVVIMAACVVGGLVAFIFEAFLCIAEDPSMFVTAMIVTFVMFLFYAPLAFVVIRKVKTAYNTKPSSKKMYEPKGQLKDYDGYCDYDDSAYDMADDENDENQET